MSDRYSTLIGWTVVYTNDEEGITYVLPGAPGPGSYAARLWSKSEAEHAARERGGPHAHVVAVFVEPAEPPAE